jgi:hypothetical protein
LLSLSAPPAPFCPADEHFRVVYDAKGRFVVHRITKEEASYKLCKVGGCGGAGGWLAGRSVAGLHTLCMLGALGWGLSGSPAVDHNAGGPVSRQG